MKKSILLTAAIAAAAALVCVGCVNDGTGDGDGRADDFLKGFDQKSSDTGMVFVEGGTFWMGCDSTDTLINYCPDSEIPRHQVSLKSFYIAKYEVTQKLWKGVTGTLPSGVDSSCGIGDNYPVYSVSWDNVNAFIDSLKVKTGKNYRLPTEAEWEYAARGGNKSKGFMYSGSNDIDEVAWHYVDKNSSAKPVGAKLPNELGIYDMSGNVREWVSDWYGKYPNNTQDNPTGPDSGETRVYRGGSYWNEYNNMFYVTYRNSEYPDNLSNTLGFRLAHD